MQLFLGPKISGRFRGLVPLGFAAAALVLTACGAPQAAPSTSATAPAVTVKHLAVGGQQIPFALPGKFSATQMAVVNSYVSFSNAILESFRTHSTAPVKAHLAPGSMMASMLAKKLGSGMGTPPLYTKVDVISVSIKGDRATMAADMSYAKMPSIVYRAVFVHSGGHWLFLHDNKVGGPKRACGV